MLTTCAGCFRLFSRRKITILKAIHNGSIRFCKWRLPVFAPKNYNFESNSQLAGANNWAMVSCFRAEKLQFWKQFTTHGCRCKGRADLFSRRKITILKAIHNPHRGKCNREKPVFAPKNYNFESNSQLPRKVGPAWGACFRAEKLQFWKQFTTWKRNKRSGVGLFSRRKITILKAIHNLIDFCHLFRIPVFAPKNYNFESNSQLWQCGYSEGLSCFRAEKLQFWKQFTTIYGYDYKLINLFSRRKITILKAIHNLL